MANGKILIVDDDADVREAIKLQLEYKGLQVLEATDGENAINILKSCDNPERVEVILSDIQLPKVNGMDCIQFLIEQAPEIPIIAITGQPDEEQAMDLLKSGVKEYLVKPVERAKLIAAVEKQIPS